jgi:hypothetical protein
MDSANVSTIERPSNRAPPPKVVQPRQTGAQVVLAIPPSELCAVFGGVDPDVAARLLSQLLGVLHPDSSQPVDPALINEALALVQGIGPTDAAEAMIAVMLVAAEYAATDTMRRAAHPAQSAAGRQSYVTLSLKAMRTFSQLLEGLNHGRGKGVTQRVIVERVNVESGGQAVVGAVARTGGAG